MNQFAREFLTILAAYFFMKLGYLVAFNNFVRIVSLKDKEQKDEILERFSRTLGYVLFTAGVFTLSVLPLRKFFPEYYLHIYMLLMAALIVFAGIKYYLYKKEGMS